MDDERPRDPASLVRFMDAIDAYKDKAVHSSAEPDDDEDGECKAVVVAWLPGEPVRLKGSDPDEWGHVVAIVARQTGCLYHVAWPRDKRTSDHFDFELEDAPDAPV